MKIKVGLFKNAENGDILSIMNLKIFYTGKGRTYQDIEDQAIGYAYAFNVAMGHDFFKDGSFVVKNDLPYAMIDDCY